MPDHAPAPASPARASAIDLVIEGPIASIDHAALIDHVRAFLDRGNDRVVCDVTSLNSSELGAVAMLARLQLMAHRFGGSIELHNASAELHDLLALVGLCDIVGACAPLGVEAQGHSEHREDASGVEEEGDPADPVA